mgnify:CR=1 FL=1
MMCVLCVLIFPMLHGKIDIIFVCLFGPKIFRILFLPVLLFGLFVRDNFFNECVFETNSNTKNCQLSDQQNREWNIFCFLFFSFSPFLFLQNTDIRLILI